MLCFIVNTFNSYRVALSDLAFKLRSSHFAITQLILHSLDTLHQAVVLTLSIIQGLSVNSQQLKTILPTNMKIYPNHCH